METRNDLTESQEFQDGSPVIYGLHGKCFVSGTELRSLAGQTIQFYRLEMKKTPLSKTMRQDMAIWVPVSSAKEKGLRQPMNKMEAEEALKILGSREYYFKASEPWNTALPKLEACIRNEGGIGLAKVASYLHVIKKRQVVPSTEINKFQDTVHRLLFRELSEALNESSKVLEERITKGFRVKMAPDS